MRLAAIIIFCLVVPAIGFSATLLVPSQFPTIQGAINAASNGDTVLVSPGTYVENINFIGKAITVTSAQGPEVTIIDGNQGGSVVKFHNGEGSNSILNEFTITNGNAIFGGGIYCNLSSPTISNNTISGNSVSGGPYSHGGGLYCRQGSPTIINNTVSGNTASGEGGGMIFVMTCNPRIEDNTITDNWAARWGGGIECYSDCSPIILNNIITSNTVSQYGGGGITLGTNCSGNIMNNTISGNSVGKHGGGIYGEANSSPTITNNTISENIAGGEGAGIFFRNGSSPRIESNTVSNNQAELFGGGIEYYNTCAPTIINNTITYNTVSQYDGGGIVFGANCSGTIINNLIAGNSVGRNGGGVYCEVDCSSTLMNNTIYGNSAATNGGGIFILDNCNLTATNTIIWDNNATQGPEIWIGSIAKPSTLTISYSNVEGGKPSIHVEPNCTLNWGAGMINANPLFTEGASGFYYLSQDPCQPGTNNPCVDTGSDLASNLGMDIYWTRTDEVTDSGMVDMGFHYGDFVFPCLQADTFAISQSTGGEANLLLLAGAANANRNYIILGSVTGTDPGTPLPGGQATLPLNWDIFTNLVIDMINTPIFLNFMGSLNAAGSANAKFDTLGPVPPAAAGIILYFAYALNSPWDFVSNPVAVEIL